MQHLRKNIINRIFLYPLSVLYGLITDLRNWLFDTGIFKQESFAVPVISVGNITAGGTGKTPFTMLLIDLLSGYYSKIVVVSRGYGRKSTGLKIVSDGHKILIPVEESGDEPFLIAQKYPDVPVIVSENRATGIKKAVDHYGAALILLDDAFQHRRVQRNCDIVLIKAGENIDQEQVLPLGYLRENLKHLRRAGIIVFTGSEDDGAEKIPNDALGVNPEDIFSCAFTVEGVVDLNLRLIGAPAMLKGKSCVAFAAIARPEQFRKTLQDHHIHVDKFIAFPDHHFYLEADHLRLAGEIKKYQSDYLITTEKDLVRINPAFLSEIKLVGIRRAGRLKDMGRFLNKLREFIDFKI